jgi:hypothetical protein
MMVFVASVTYRTTVKRTRPRLMTYDLFRGFLIVCDLFAGSALLLHSLEYRFVHICT